MPELHWQKSTFSGGPQGDCLHVATAPDGTIRLRESDAPRIVLTATARELAALLRSIKSRSPHGFRPPAGLPAAVRRPAGPLPRAAYGSAAYSAHAALLV